MLQEAPGIEPGNMAMSRMTERRAKAIITSKLQVNGACVTGVVVWGNPPGTKYVDVKRARVHKYEGAIVGPEWFSLPFPEMVHDDKWLETEFLDKLSGKENNQYSMAQNIISTYGSLLISAHVFMKYLMKGFTFGHLRKERYGRWNAWPQSC